MAAPEKVLALRTELRLWAASWALRSFWWLLPKAGAPSEVLVATDRLVVALYRHQWRTS